MRARLLAFVTSAAALVVNVTMAAIQDENILLPIPDGFKVGSHAENTTNLLSEYVPQNESVESWSKMVTERIYKGAPTFTDPEMLQSVLLVQWKGACPGGEGYKIGDVTENGYKASYWAFNCEVNPRTKLGESMVRKVIVGSDAVYDVQFAYRAAAKAELMQSAATFLRRALVCDPRAKEHPCPSGL